VDLTAYRAAIKDELLCLYSAFGNCNVTNADRTVHQGIEAGLGVALFKNVFARGGQADKLWLNLAYTFNDFRFDHDAAFGNNLLPGAAATSFAPRCSTSTQRLLFRAERRVGAAGLLRRQRQHAEHGWLCDLRTEGRVRRRRPLFGLYRGA